MAYNIVAAGGSLYLMTTAGVGSALSLPTGVTLSSSRAARMSVLGRNVAIVNGPNRSLVVDALGVVRPMQLTPPSSPVALTSANAGGLSGSFRVKYTYIVKDSNGAILAESAFSPESASSGTITSKLLQCATIGISPDSAVTHRRLYRTTTGPGTTYYHWLDVDGNTVTSAADDLADSALTLTAAPTELGVGPGALLGTYMTVCVEWKGRLWAVGDIDIDTLRYSGNGLYYGWPSTYGLSIAPIGNDQFGITGLLPRRDELGVGRRDHLWRVIHNGENADGTPNFDVKRAYKGKGPYSADSCLVVDDIAYFLSQDGVYAWGPEGVECISNGKVRKWFASDTYFNRALYSSAFAKYNSTYHGYELHLAAAGSSNIDRWVFYDIAGKKWFGPHKTDEFTPSAAGVIVDSNALHIPCIGSSNGYVYLTNQAGFADGSTAISMSVLSKLHDGNTPDIEKLFKTLSLQNKRQTTAGNFRVKVYFVKDDSDLDALTLAKNFLTDMRKNRQLTSNLGHGRMVQLEFTEDTVSLGCELYGYELPFHELGQRSR